MEIFRLARTITLFFSLYILFCSPVIATGYYVSGSSGSDLNNGSISSPWQTITKVNSANLQPGDKVYFKCGDTFRGITIKPKKGVTYASYGTGPKPIISGASTISTSSGWTQYTAQGSGHIYRKNIGSIMNDLSYAYCPNLFFNGKLMVPARYPNSGFLRGDSVFSVPYPPSFWNKLVVEFKDVNATNTLGWANIVGAHLTGYHSWTVITEKVKSYNPSTGHYTLDSLDLDMDQGHRLYYLSRKLVYLDTLNEWYYDGAYIYVWFPGTSGPSPTDVIEHNNKVTLNMGNPTNVFGVHAYQINDITIKDLEFRHWLKAGVCFTSDTNVTVSNCTFYGCQIGVWGVGNATQPVHSALIQNNTFNNIVQVGMELSSVNSSTVTYNTFHNIADTDILDGLGQSGLPEKWGIFSEHWFGYGMMHTGDNCTITNNNFYSTGRTGMNVGGLNTVIKNNVIKDPCLLHSDCGGIRPEAGSIVESNIILNGDEYMPEFYYHGPCGIYPDYTDSVTIKNNTVVNTRMGIGPNHSKHNISTGNTVYGSSRYQFRLFRHSSGQLSNTIKNNIFFGLDHTQKSLIWTNDDRNPSGIDDNSILDSNKYWNPYSYYYNIIYDPDFNSAEQWYDLKQWQDKPSWTKDDHSKKEFVFMNEPYKIISTVGSEKITNGNFNSSGTGWTAGGVVAATYPSGISGMNGKCVQLDYNSNWAGKFYQSNLSLLPNKYHRVTFRLKSYANDGKWFCMKIIQNGTTLYERYFKATTVPQDYINVFKTGNSLLPYTLQFEFYGTPTTGEYFYLDDVSLYEANVNYLDPTYKFPIFVNDTSIQKSFSLSPFRFLDLDSNTITSAQLLLQPFTSKILIRNGILATTDKTLLCPTDSATLDAGTGFQTYQWYKGGTLITGASSRYHVVNYSSVGSYSCHVTESSGWEWDSQVITIGAQTPANCLTSINDENKKVNLNVFPNPNKGEFTLNINSAKTTDIQVKIIDVTGQEILSFANEKIISAIFPIYLGNNAPGVYYVVITSDDAIVTQRIIITR